jgi:DNA polymerase-3 subunit beta
MKITCDREKLLTAFQTASAVIPSRTPKPVLKSVRLDALTDQAVVLATDLEVAVRAQAAGVQIESPGSVLLPVDRFGPILRESSDPTLRIESDGGSIVVKGERSYFKLPCENPDEFPEVADFNEDKYHKTSARLFRECVRRTAFATDNESTRYALGGVLLELGPNTITTVGTDGRRMACMEGPSESVGGHETTGTTTIVPSRALQLIERSLGTDAEGEVHIAVRANDLLIRGARVMIYTRLVEGRFPQWRAVYPRPDESVRVEMTVGPLHAAVRQAAIVTSDESKGVEFTFAEGKLVLAGQAADRGQSRIELPIAYDGAPISITLNPHFLSDFLRVLDSETTFGMDVRGPETAAVCRTADGYSYVIMPLSREKDRRDGARSS